MIEAASGLLPAGVSPAVGLLLVGLSFLTSGLTATFGIGGGMVMLGALAGSVPPASIIAVHAVVQVFSNLGRAWLQRRHVLWPFVARFAVGSVVGITAGAALFQALPTPWLLGLIGGFILLMVWVPRPSIPGLSRVGVFAGGVVTSAITMFVGATGPFVQAMLLPLGLERRTIVATQAMATVIQHALKIVAFGALGFSLTEWLPLLAGMVAAGFLGTWCGTVLLEKLPERLFQVVIKTLLTVIALDLLRRALGF